MAIIQGKEKMWSVLLGGTMATSITTFTFWWFSSSVTGVIASPTPDMITAAITGVIATLFSAALVYLTANTEPVPDTSLKTTETVAKTSTVEATPDSTTLKP